MEIPTKRGFAYAQVTHDHPVYGHLLRVLVGLDKERQADLQALASRETNYVCFVRVVDGVRRGLLRLVGNRPVPESARSFPVFRFAVRIGHERITRWSLWDGETFDRVPVAAPTEAQRHLPVEERVTAGVLIERIESGWSPAEWEVREGWSVDQGLATAVSTGTLSDQPGDTQHFLYFSVAGAAISAQQRLIEMGYATALEKQDHDWCVVVHEIARSSTESVSSRLESLARELGGTYEGRETRAT